MGVLDGLFGVMTGIGLDEETIGKYTKALEKLFNDTEKSLKINVENQKILQKNGEMLKSICHYITEMEKLRKEYEKIDGKRISPHKNPTF